MLTNWSLTGMNGISSTGSYLWPASKESVVSQRHIQRSADRQTFTITISGTTSTAWKLFSFHATTTEGNTPRA